MEGAEGSVGAPLCFDYRDYRGQGGSDLRQSETGNTVLKEELFK